MPVETCSCRNGVKLSRYSFLNHYENKYEDTITITGIYVHYYYYNYN